VRRCYSGSLHEIARANHYLGEFRVSHVNNSSPELLKSDQLNRSDGAPPDHLRPAIGAQRDKLATLLSIDAPEMPANSSRSDKQLIDSFDLRALDTDFYADPYRTFRALRERSPVHRCPDGTVFLTRHRDLVRVYRDPKTFSSAKQAQFKPLFGDGPLYEHHTTSLVFNDPPLHTSVRKAIGDALAPRVIANMEQDLIVLVDRLIEDLQGKSHFDLMDDFASVIPIEVIGNLLNIDHSDRAPLRAWSAAILGALEFGLDEHRRHEGNAAVDEFVEFLRTLINARRSTLGGDDIITRLIRWESNEFKLSEKQIYHQCIFLLNAGHETTTNLIGNAVHALLADPAAHRQLCDNLDLIDLAVEEFLRFDPPVQLGNRITTTDVEFDNIPIAAGTTLTLCIGAANRDPEVFTAPDTLDISRIVNPQLAFAGGIHACAGMAVARLEARVALEKLLKNFPDLARDGPGVRAQRARFRGFISLPMCLKNRR
jgi:cytochrome P450